MVEYKNFIGTSDTRKHLKISRIITHEMPVLRILCWWYFGCL